MSTSNAIVLARGDVRFDNTPLVSLDGGGRRNLRVLTNSEKKSFRACHQMHHLRYHLLKRPLRARDPLRFGSAFHLALEAWWRAAQAGGDRLAAARSALRLGELEPKEAAKAEALIIGYDVRWGEEVIEVLDVEAEFKTPIINPVTGASSRTYVLGGKIDAIARLADGQVYIVEHKTSGENIEAGSDYWQRLRLDAQVSDYLIGARALGHDIVGCLYDVIGKPKIEPMEATPEDKRQYTKKDHRLYAGQRERDETIEEYADRVRTHVAENLDRYFVRGTVVRTAEEERDAAADTWNTAREMREAELAQRHPRNIDSCVRWGSKCEYWAVCTKEADVNDPLLFRTARAAHEELSGAAVAVPVSMSTYEGEIDL
jgi:hypothetical protein